MDRKALIGLLSGVTVVIATMIGVALVNPRQAEGADALRATARDCATGPRTAEPGYSVPSPSVGCPRSE